MSRFARILQAAFGRGEPGSTVPGASAVSVPADKPSATTATPTPAPATAPRTRRMLRARYDAA
jgi:hypothetical protein